MYICFDTFTGSQARARASQPVSMLLERLDLSADGQPIRLHGEKQQALLEQACVSSTNCLAAQTPKRKT